MHFFKRLPALFLALALLSALSAPARAAQAAGERDSFYRRHAGECVMDEGSYYLNGASGYVTVRRSPQSEQASDHLLNERVVDVTCVWRDREGVRWGQLRYRTAGRGLANCDEQGERCGWVRMSELARRYDRTRFLSEHLSQFVSGEATLDVADYERVGLWQFPGCGGRPEPVTWYLNGQSEPVLHFPATWTDSSGRRWGSIRLEGASGFVCLDDPGLTDNRLPEVETGYLAIPAADVSTLPPETKEAASAIPAWAWPAGVAVLAAALAAVLELRERRDKKKGWV